MCFLTPVVIIETMRGYNDHSLLFLSLISQKDTLKWPPAVTRVPALRHYCVRSFDDWYAMSEV